MFFEIMYGPHCLRIVFVRILTILFSLAVTSCYLSSSREYVSIEDAFTQEECDAGLRPLPEPCPEPSVERPGYVFESILPGGDMSIATDGCDAVYLVLSRLEEMSISRSFDEGTTFDEPRPLFEGSSPYALSDIHGTIHLVFLRGGSVVHCTLDDAGESFGEEIHFTVPGVPRLLEGQVIIHRVADTRGNNEIAIAWKTDNPDAVWFVTTAGTEEFLDPIQLHVGEQVLPPRICMVGSDRVVVVWATRDVDPGIHRAAVSNDRGRTFSISELGTGNYNSNVDVDCSPDGRALAVWDHGGAIMTDRGLRIAALDACGTWSSEPTTIMADNIWAHYFYPHVVISGEQALVTWNANFGSEFGYAILDLDANILSDVVLGIDITGDGDTDRFIRSCPLCPGDGFVILTQGRYEHSRPDLTGPGLATWIDPSGDIISFQELGPYDQTQIRADMICTRRSRALMVWLDDGLTFASWKP